MEEDASVLLDDTLERTEIGRAGGGLWRGLWHGVVLPWSPGQH